MSQPAAGKGRAYSEGFTTEILARGTERWDGAGDEEMAPYHLSVPLKDDPVSLASATAG